MIMDELCYKIFHIPGYSDFGGIRKRLHGDLDSYLVNKIHKLETETILISNEDQYLEFNSKHNLLIPRIPFKWGELGIWASNLLAIENFLKTDYKYLMLMEDDILVQDKDKFLPLLQEYMNQIPEDWQAFSYFVDPNQYSRFGVEIVYGEFSGFEFHKLIEEEKGPVVKAYQDWSMLCYVLNRKSAEDILKDVKISGLRHPIDWHLFRQPNKFITYTVHPLAEKGCDRYNTISTFQQREFPVEINIERDKSMTRTLAENLPNWFLGNKTQDDFNKLLEPFKGKPNLNFLEIGSFCGNSAAWTIQNILTDKTSKITCIDPWNGNIAHETFDFSDVEAAFDEQLEPFKDQLIKHKAYSDQWLMKNRSEMYDFIYIDGDHMPHAFMIDALLSWELLKPGGIMAIDDYGWTHPQGSQYNPAAAIDMFVSMYSDHLTVIEKGWQVWIKKNEDYVRPEHIHE